MILAVVAMAATIGAQPASVPAARGDEQKVCHKVTYTGSRLGATSICKTKKEWDELQWEHDHLLREQQQLDRALNNNG